ncbi:conserved exported hypothetical protein [Paraburkholderia piptadeniae]|uniref:GNAT family acetyltransferase n=1 Tax=Paraburkholderia piptadeniae TaxID=1701573 RepID=A0A1N7RIH6_9BURK|nr:DUF2798 domain-containing protein [Paraburkholderia piptadeniae]SIT34916.1 conserved exported hypothetical protein [Paraburkholderia piptadeniae]
MFRIPHRFNHFLFSGIQSAMTCAVASAVSSVPFYSEKTFFDHWIRSYLLSWMVMLPLALVAAPLIRRIVGLLTASTRH